MMGGGRIAECGQFFTERGPSACIACSGGRRPGCRCPGCAAGQHRVVSKLDTYSPERERGRRQDNSDLFRRPRRDEDYLE